jgi:aminoglycoside phosphotransferase family enzyme/predicted kinase
MVAWKGNMGRGCWEMTRPGRRAPALPPREDAACAARDAAAGGNGEAYAAVAETHSAVVFFVGERAYKLKKPVDLGFLDFTERDARAAACRREVDLNRRFAPDVYLGVAGVHGPDGRVCEHLVVMRRMPAARRLSTLVRAGAPVEAPLRQVARVLAARHAAAPRSAQISAQGSPDALWARWEASIAQLRGPAGRLPGPAAVDEVERLAGRFVAGRGALFEERIRGGYIVDGHGDLLADDIFCLDDGVRILDCLEFDDRLRWVDGLDDAAFLAMDLERIGSPRLAEKFTGWYAEYSADPAPAPLRHHYIAYRALVRAKIAALRAAQGDPLGGADARRLAGMTLSHLRAGAVTMVLVGGPPGTGKSALAGTLAGQLGFTVLSTDRIRKELAGVPPEQRCAAPWRSGIYSPAWTERTYTELLRRAGRLLARGESVIADASWGSPRHRTAAAALADTARADLVALRCAAPADVVQRRLSARTCGVSDADVAVARRMAAAHEPWPEAVTIDTGGLGPGGGQVPGTAAVRQALRAIRPPGPQQRSHGGPQRLPAAADLGLAPGTTGNGQDGPVRGRS